jgi:hypothetical protein
MNLQYSWFSNILVFSFQYQFPLLPLKSFSFKDILLWSVNFNNRAIGQTKLDMLWDNFKLEVRDKTIDHCKKLANSKKNEIKKHYL